MTRLVEATPADLRIVEAIEQRCFPSPWTLDMYAQELERDLAQLWLALSDGGDPQGFSCAWHVPPEAHLLRIAVDPAARRRGVGGDLLRGVIRRARSAGCTTLSLEVGADNAAALALYAPAKFAEIGRREGYYRSPDGAREDAIVMQLRLDVAGGGPSKS